MKRKSYLLIFSVLLLFSSCASRYKHALFTAPSDVVTDTLRTVYVANNKGPEDVYYKIKPDDQLSIRNLQNVEFGAQAISSNGGSAGGQSAISSFTVEYDGSVTLPVIGKVNVGGLTRREATKKLQDLFSKTLLKDPIIELNIVNLKVTLLGEFNRQGNYLIEKDNTSFTEILGQAGGFSERAETKKIKIIRGDKKNPEIIYVNLKSLNSLADPKLTLQNNDILYAEPRKVYSSSEGLQNAMLFIQPVLIILNSAVILYNLSR
ncbi:polysaccharide biosynthesis/export family protein [Desertivirga brevis]|uniref:polysaccharide biosynthesis/export family protein n=1 Tax=Desertivirga brevis TaxID=2810310 RepID=UPI001A956992|nr:polysaccharide biosynthesis/export family protein [Pedobacter sp. SYSU D00873]